MESMITYCTIERPNGRADIDSILMSAIILTVPIEIGRSNDRADNNNNYTVARIITIETARIITNDKWRVQRSGGVTSDWVLRGSST